MIVRILTEGQVDLPDALLDELNVLDAAAEQAVDAGDEAAFSAALGRLLDRVRTGGRRLADDVLVPSDLVLPPPDATIDDVRHLFDTASGADGLVPG
ncbi:MAG TPA: hypothetical protein VM433_14945 [Mycobacteriales bacterium]|nr:hypothetical protein [Mycobacteriales bacterium]